MHTPVAELMDDRLEPPLGILYLATLLKKSGISCEICDLSGFPEEDWEDNISYGDIYGFSTYSVNYYKTLKLRDIAKKKNPNAITFAGGPHASADAERCSNEFDIIIVGEAESCFIKLVKSIINGEKPSGIFIGEPIEDLDSLPFPDYELVDLGSYHRVVEGKKSISLVTSRGCPFKCTFCNSLVFSKGRLRFRSPENVVQEMRQLMEKYGISTFRFNDDLFTFTSDRTIEMAAALKPLNIFYRVFARSNSLTEEASKALFESGCRHVAIGIESMSDTMLKLMNKNTDKVTNIMALENAKRAGLKTRIYIIVGFPGETKQTFQESLDVLMQCEFDEFVIYPFIPYPGTSIWNKPDIWGATIDRDFSKYIQIGYDEGKYPGTCYVVATEDFSPGDVKKWRETMYDKLSEKHILAINALENR